MLELVNISKNYNPGSVNELCQCLNFKGTCPSMTILENMSLAENKGKPYNLGRGVNKARVEAYREMLRPLNLSLEDKLGVQVGALSGGQRQALALLMATMTPIDFLILDEHTAALDPKTAEIIMELTEKVVKEKGVTTIMVTHNLRYAVEYGNRLIMMHEGNVILDKSSTKPSSIFPTFNISLPPCPCCFDGVKCKYLQFTLPEC